MSDAWNLYYADIPCAVTVVPTKSFATVGGIVEINLIALTNGAACRKQVVETDIPGMGSGRQDRRRQDTERVAAPVRRPHHRAAHETDPADHPGQRLAIWFSENGRTSWR